MKTKSMKIATIVTLVALCLSCMCVTVFAANGMKAVGTSVELNGTDVGYATVSISASSKTDIALFQGTWSVSELEGSSKYFTLKGISSSAFVFGANDNDANVSTGAMIWVDPNYEWVTFETDAEILTATYEVAANTPAGVYTVEFIGEAIGDAEWNDLTENFTFTITVTTAPSCDHSTTKAVPNGDGATHKLVCTNEACNGYVVTASENCSGGTATCTAKATCTKCGQSYGDLAEHTYDETVAAQAATCLAGGNVAYKQCTVCELYFAADAAADATAGQETNADFLTDKDSTNHVGHDHYNTTTTDHQSICSCGLEMGKAADHTWENGNCAVCEFVCPHGGEVGSTPEGYEYTGDNTHTYYYTCDCGVKYGDESEECEDADGDGNHTCDKCSNTAALTNCSGGTATCTEKATCSECGQKHGEFDSNNHKNTSVADDFHSTGNNTHYQWIACNDCDNKQIETTEVENCSGGTAACVAKAICEKCNTAYGDLGDHTYGETVAAQAATCLAGGNVAYKQCDVCELYFAADAAADSNEGKATNEDFLTKKDSTNHVGKETTSCTNDGATHTVTVTCECSGVVSETKGIDHSYNHQTRDFECECGAKYTGWSQSTDGEGTTWTCYVKNGEVLHGWNEVEGSWYYFSTTSGQPATGMTRVPYPTEAINGVTYRPNAEDLAYYNAHKDTSKYTDATYALFVFDQDGKFQQTTGIVNGKHFAVNGCVAWHVGFVEIDGAYYYFAGDTSEEMNGNVMVTGKVYATRDYNTGKAVDGAIYMFGEDGKLIKNAGIVDGYYYNEDNSLAIGAGLVECGDGYIYVRSNGQVVKNAKYWLSASKLEAAGITDYKAGIYSFDENGMLVLPEIEPELNGIVEKDGEYYYYVDGVKQAGAGVVEMSDDKGTFYIYVTSDGTLATGKYWPTNLNGLLKSGCYDWGTDGKYYPNAN